MIDPDTVSAAAEQADTSLREAHAATEAIPDTDSTLAVAASLLAFAEQLRAFRLAFVDQAERARKAARR